MLDRIAVSLALLCLVACDGDPAPTDAAVPDGALADGAVADAGPTFEPAAHTLSAPVEVFRDELGVVHVYGQEDADVFYGSGYMQAVDRLFSMDLARRRALGRRAEILGADYVDDDRLVRTVGIARAIRTRACAARWCSGCST